MAKLVLLYPTPLNTDEFNLRVQGRFADVVAGLPGLRGLSCSDTLSCSLDPCPHAVIEICFESHGALTHALAKAEVQSEMAALQDLVPSGVVSLIYETETLYPSREDHP
ncbi:hypothetical protein FHS85_002400 [Rhodoligotrophos appendicifer]|uniref:hypothetical protein n=1 Tax=Rhodoligotrophos appendicifer TaxID=987056 RepID=UPI001185A241|nr:hypothetical protein [Rhodoligotrophos appendicifer]